MRLLVVLTLGFTMLSCRDVQPLPVSTPVSGYQLNGILTTSNSIPISGAQVILYYNYIPLDYGPVDSIQVIVRDTNVTVDVSVVTTSLDFVVTLFHGHRSAGLVPPFFWNGRDSKGALRPSGKYLLRYSLGSTIVKYSTFVLEGTPTATTDVNGLFTITNDHFPIGEIFDVYNDDGSYFATLQLIPNVALEFQYGSHASVFPSVDLTENFVTFGAFTL